MDVSHEDVLLIVAAIHSVAQAVCCVAGVLSIGIVFREMRGR